MNTVDACKVSKVGRLISEEIAVKASQDIYIYIYIYIYIERERERERDISTIVPNSTKQTVDLLIS